MRGYYWTGQRIILTDGWREEVCGGVVKERGGAIEEKGIWKDGMGMCVVEGCEVGFGSDVIEAGSDGKTERRDGMGRDCKYQYLLVVEVERGIV